jgi:hypothetical protein
MDSYLFNTGLLEHVDDLRHSILRMCADMEQYIATTAPISLSQTVASAFLEHDVI